MKHKIKLDKKDVRVIAAVKRCTDCGMKTEKPYRVVIDFRSAGFLSSVHGDMCKPCAERLAKRIREGL